MISAVNTINSANSDLKLNNKEKPVGFIRTKIFNRSILNKTLIDSGNLFGDLISEEFAKLLNLKIFGTPRDAGTASKNGTITVMGRVKPIQLYLEGIDGTVVIQPYVVKDLAHAINLGQHFLRRYKASLDFNETGALIRIKGHTTVLTSSSAKIIRPSLDVRIKSMLDKYELNGSNPYSANSNILDLRVNEIQKGADDFPGTFRKDHKKSIEFSSTKINVFNPNRTVLKAGHTTVVELTRGSPTKLASVPIRSQNDVYLCPKQDHTALNENGIFVLPGVYFRDSNNVKVHVLNLESTDKLLPKNCHMGHLLEAENHIENSINLLDHRSPTTLTQDELLERRSYIIDQLKLDENDILKDYPDIKEEVIRIFMDGWDAISIDDSDYGKTDLISFKIKLIKDTEPVRAKLRTLNPMQEKDLERQINAWLEAGVIEPSDSPWASALVPCKKKGSDNYRWCTDFRALNTLTVKDAYPLNSIESNLHKLSGSKIFSTLDSAGAFHSIVVDNDSRDYTAFNTFRGQYRYARLPFGLCNAPSAYSRLVQMALDRLPRGFALAYLDDIICHSVNVQDHVDHLRQVIDVHVQCGMKLNLRKCELFRSEVVYLGHLVSEQGIQMVPSYVDKVKDWPLPTTGAELKSFLGFSGYYRGFIKEYSDLTAEMNSMKNSKCLEWTESTKAKFERLKQCFASSPVRGFPQYDNPEPFILDTDFSATNMAAVLSQVQGGKEVFLGCTAKKCNKAESSYASHKGELGALVLGLNKFEHILRARPFKVRTDSRCVQFLHSMKEYRGIYARWQCFISSFNFDIEHRSGSKQINADALSRRPGVSEDPGLEQLDPNLPYSDVEDIYVIQGVTAISDSEMQKHTADDIVLSRICEFVKTKIKPDKQIRKTLTAEGMSYINHFESLLFENGILYYQEPELNGIQKPKRMCIPMKLQERAFLFCHADPTSGHYGINMTFSRMRERFYFPNMYTFISARILNCVECITKRSTHKNAQHKMHREQLSYFGQRVYCDIVGPMSGSKYNGKICRYLLTIMDGFTRYLVAVPIPDQKTETLVTEIIDNWILVHGCFEVLHTDNGSNYTSNLFKEVMARLGVIKTYTPAYSPEGNRVERSHKVLGDIIRSDNRFEDQNWTSKINAAVMAYNSSVNRITGMSPFEAVFGRNPTLPIDLIFPLHTTESQSWSTHVEGLRSKFSTLCQKICQTQNTVISRENAKFQARSKPEIVEGDTVFYFLAHINPGLSKKLSKRWIGPFRVCKVISEALLVIYPIGTWARNPREISVIANRVHKVDLKLSVTSYDGADEPVDLSEISSEINENAEQLSYGSFMDSDNETYETHDEPNRAHNEPDILLGDIDPMTQDQGLLQDEFADCEDFGSPPMLENDSLSLNNNQGSSASAEDSRSVETRSESDAQVGRTPMFRRAKFLAKSKLLKLK